MMPTHTLRPYLHPQKRQRTGLRLLAALLLVAAFPATATTFTVNRLDDLPDASPGDGSCAISTGSPNKCTLRAAIEEANANGNPAQTDQIQFSLGLIVINISGTPLPTITERLIIDGRTAPSYNGSATETAGAPPSVYINGGSLTGTTADGFRINGTSLSAIHAIGVTGFPDNGIEVVNGTITTLDGNWIGIARNGTIDGNDGAGVYLSGCDNCVIGQDVLSFGVVDGVGNAISNNGESGIYVINGGDNLIAGNLIGPDPFGNVTMGNSQHGIQLLGANNRIGDLQGGIGGAVTAAPNTIRGNTLDGIRAQVGGQYIYANLILYNGGNGVSLNGTGSRLGFTATQGNFIRGNTGHGVAIGNLFASTGNLVAYNGIYQNTSRGVYVYNGGSNEVKSNEIYLNTDDAVRVDADNTTISNNLIGLQGAVLFGNGNNGVVLTGSNNNVTNNSIAQMVDDGIDVVSGDGNVISGNQIGMSNSGLDWGNNTGAEFLTAGVRVRNGATNTGIEDNRIGFNNQGIILEGGGTDVCGNRIGVGSGDELAGNVGEGIWLPGGGNLIGDPDNGCSANVIGDNGSDGIQIDSPANIIRGNQIGGVPGVDLGNHNGGILLTTANAYLNEIKGNTLVFNDNDGVRVGSTSGTRNRIEQNSFEWNGDIGIDIDDDSVTNNDDFDADTGPNNRQNYPVITALVGGVGELSVTYRVDSDTGSSVYPLSVDFYLKGGGTNQGRQFIHRDTYTLENVEKTINVPLPPGVSTDGLTTMVIDNDGNSSEFSPPVNFTAIPLMDNIFKDGFED